MDYRFFTNCTIWLVCSIVTLNIAWARTVSNDDLRKVEAQVEQQSAEHQKLQKQADFIGQELDKVNKEMIVTARAIQNSEDKLSKMEKQLELLRHDLEETEKSFVKENDNLIRTLSALQNVATRPTESLLVQPLTPVDIIRSAMMLRVSVPFFEENAKQQAADGPHVVDWLFYSMAEGTGFIMAIHHDHYLLGIHHCADTDSQSSLGDQIDIIVEETTIGNHCICGQCLLPGTALQTGAWLVEGNMAIGANAAHEQVDASCSLYGFLVVLALCL